jgi:hypothetical protein
VRVETERTADVPAFTMAALMLAVFTVSVGFGVVLPLLPYLIERLLGAGVTAAQVARHTGLLFAATALPGASFVLAAGFTVLGFLLSVGLPHGLVLPESDSRPVST